MKLEKKEKIIRKQKFRNILVRNKKINKINIFILGAGLLLTLLGQNQVASVLIWTGVAIFIYTTLTSAFARRAKI
ncbi:hypothetical protein V7O62_00770 [Methanolobus sp. ZRKC2]|uniref:hypothetical protein n=1 Tax=Methanolobus sp. ZRKC2 TaxID=3125783 RepID=UPI003247BA0F